MLGLASIEEVCEAKRITLGTLDPLIKRQRFDLITPVHK
jgi:hypothetical protein